MLVMTLTLSEPEIKTFQFHNFQSQVTQLQCKGQRHSLLVQQLELMFSLDFLIEIIVLFLVCACIVVYIDGLKFKLTKNVA